MADNQSNDVTLRDIFDRLKTGIVGTVTSSIDSDLDLASKDIISYRSQASQKNFIEIFKGMISKSTFSGLPGGSGFGTANIAAFGQGARLQRYRMYDSIVSNIPYCHRALDVLVDNILSPDDITKISLDVKAQKYLEDDVNIETNTRNIREFIDKLKIEDYLDIIVKNTLQFGDFFCEIADDKTALTSKSSFIAERDESQPSIITEAQLLLDIPSEPSSKDTFNVSMEKNSLEINIDYSCLSETIDKDEDPELDINNIHLVFYEPKRVLRLQSTMFPICFGYLIFPASLYSPNLMLQDHLVNNICASILSSIEKKIPKMKISEVDDKDLKDIIRTMIRESDPARAMNIRFVSPEKMQHFQIPTTKYYPYGESILDCVQFQAKVLMALETALAIYRLNRSIQKRKIGIEIGLPRDVKKQIENVKEEMKKKKISLDSFGTVDTIPSMVSSFEDVFTPMKDGKPFVTIDPFDDAGSDTRGKVDEVRIIRDMVVAGLGVTPAYVGIEENVNSRATLSGESMIFARTIVRHQKYLSRQVQNLIMKIYKLVDPEKALEINNDIIVSFPVPKSLQFENEAKIMADLANLIQILETLGIPREYLKKRYLPSFDWDEIKKYEIEAKVDQNLRAMSPDELASMAGGLGAMGSPMGMSPMGVMPPMGPADPTMGGMGGVPPVM